MRVIELTYMWYAAVLSARLGLGKGGISWGSEELLSQSLQVPEGLHVWRHVEGAMCSIMFACNILTLHAIISSPGCGVQSFNEISHVHNGHRHGSIVFNGVTSVTLVDTLVESMQTLGQSTVPYGPAITSHSHVGPLLYIYYPFSS